MQNMQTERKRAIVTFVRPIFRRAKPKYSNYLFSKSAITAFWLSGAAIVVMEAVTHDKQTNINRAAKNMRRNSRLIHQAALSSTMRHKTRPALNTSVLFHCCAELRFLGRKRDVMAAYVVQPISPLLI